MNYGYTEHNMGESHRHYVEQKKPDMIERMTLLNDSKSEVKYGDKNQIHCPRGEDESIDCNCLESLSGVIKGSMS